ncbi:MAG: hypothetical protein ABI429_04015 [Jatrophihabitantaceae bacterium]
MPTTRPRYQITETPEVAQAIDAAAKKWPGESRGRLLLRLVAAGRDVINDGRAVEAASRRRAVARTAGKYPGAFAAGHLEELRQDWPE